ncbi:unnamed protein product [Paramecium primaurelia]|uniref:Uncharacterized protein n=1 Tax=Paramecium primaurelia TaxID=5886 RepID=A0A8S1JQY9_PARPR|nr:unnamed protein product [Paramecium primaurelia]
MNQNKCQSDSGGTKIKGPEEDTFLLVMNQVLDRHKSIAAKNNESQLLQNALKALQQELNEAESKNPGSAKQILDSIFNN